MVEERVQKLQQEKTIDQAEVCKTVIKPIVPRTSRRRRKKKNKQKILLIVLIIVLGVIIGSVLAILNSLPTKEREPVQEIGGIPVTVDLLKEEVPGRPGITRNVKYIVIHETGNTGANANAVSHNSYLHRVSETEPLSWHYTVDDQGIFQHLPDTEVGFHAGDQLVEDGGNSSGIGIEMCVNPENDYEQTLKNTAVLVKFLMDAYHLDIDDVKKHQDFSGKMCPEQLIKADRWQEFIQMVQKATY